MPKQNGKTLAPHEALELRELLNSEITGYKKLQSTFAMAEDEDLKEVIKESMKCKRENIEQLQNFITAQSKMQ